MGGVFETSTDSSSERLRPLRVAVQKANLMRTAGELAEDLGWRVESRDEQAGKIVCRAEGGFLRGSSTITISFDGPEGIPSTTVGLRSVTSGGLLSPDRGNVARFLQLFARRTSASI